MSRRSTVYIALALATAVAVVVLAQFGWPGRTPPDPLRISTGTEGGTYITLGGQLARILDEFGSKPLIDKVQPLPSGGSVENARRLATGKADLAFVVEPVLAATEPREQLSVLLALYDNVAQILIRKDSGIESLEDLKGKRVFAGVPNSGTRWLTTRMLEAVGVGDAEYELASLDRWDQVEGALRSRQIDAAFFVTAMPVHAVVQSLNSGCCELLGLDADLDRIVHGVPGLTAHEIPALTYRQNP